MLEIKVKDWFEVKIDELNQYLPYDETITPKEGDKLEKYFLENPILDYDFIDWEKYREMVLQMFLDSEILGEVRCEVNEND